MDPRTVNIERFRPFFTTKVSLVFGLAGIAFGIAAVFVFTGTVTKVLLVLACVSLFVAKLVANLRNSKPD